MKDFLRRHPGLVVALLVVFLVAVPLLTAGGIFLAATAAQKWLGDQGLAVVVAVLFGLVVWGSLREWSGKPDKTLGTALLIGLLVYVFVAMGLEHEARLKALTERVEALEKAQGGRGN